MAVRRKTVEHRADGAVADDRILDGEMEGEIGIPIDVERNEAEDDRVAHP